MVSIMRRVAAISAGPMSARPRGRRALSLLDLSDLSFIVMLHRMGRLVAAALLTGKGPHMALAPRTSAAPNDLEAYWMPFTSNRAFKKAPRLIARAKDMHYITTDGRKLIDGTAGLWCCHRRQKRRADRRRDPAPGGRARLRARVPVRPSAGVRAGQPHLGARA